MQSNRILGLSTTLEEHNNTISVLSKENQKLKSELLKFTVKSDEKEQALQKNVSKEASNSVKAITERDELRKELLQAKNNLKEEIVQHQKLSAQYDQCRREADTKEKKLFSEIATLHKKIDEERTLNNQIYNGNIYFYDAF
jgi:septal ring factor EnvC (AmiA/AmiB activator)